MADQLASVGIMDDEKYLNGETERPTTTDVFRKPSVVTANTITPTVYLTGSYSATPEAKAKELTKLFRSLISRGLFKSVEDAAREGVPTGAFVLIEGKSEGDISVAVVPFIRLKTGAELEQAK